MKSAQNMVAMMMMPMWSRLVAEVLGGVDINWSPPIMDWSHHYGYRDGDGDDDNDDDDDDHDGDDDRYDDDDDVDNEDHDNIEYCCIIYSKHPF